MKKSLVSIIIALFFGFLFNVSCSGDYVEEELPSGQSDSQPSQTGQIVNFLLISPDANIQHVNGTQNQAKVTIGKDQILNLKVLYLSSSQQPVANATITYTVSDGSIEDSQVNASGAMTDANGNASIQLKGGIGGDDKKADFTIKASGDKAADAIFTVELRYQETTTEPTPETPTTYAGAYTLVNKMDLNTAIPEEISEALDYITDFFVNPGKMIGDLVSEKICELLGLEEDGWQGTVCSGIKIAVPFAVNSLMTYVTTKYTEANTTMQVGKDVSNIWRNFTIESKLNISEVSGNQANKTHESWDAFIFDWNGESKRYSAADLGITSILKSAEFIATIESGKMKLAEHSYEMYWGEFLIGIMNKLVIPALTSGQANNLKDAVAKWVDCSRIGEWISDTLEFDGSNIGASVCTSLLGMAVDKLEGYVKEQTSNIEAVFSFKTDDSKECKISDSNNDKQMDTIGTPQTESAATNTNDCKAVGTLKYNDYNDQSVHTFSAYFSGTRTGSYSAN